MLSKKLLWKFDFQYYFLLFHVREVHDSISDMWYCRIWLTSREHKYHVSFVEMCILIICVFLGSNIGFRMQSKHEYNWMERIKFRIVHLDCNTYFFASIFGAPFFFCVVLLIVHRITFILASTRNLMSAIFFSSPLLVIKYKSGCKLGGKA